MRDTEAKKELDTLINNARFRCHRPIRVAEILFHSRKGDIDNILDDEEYRVQSSNWRDNISVRLTGKGSSSSRSYQKDFSSLISPKVLQKLDDINCEHAGLVETYIYTKLRESKWRGLIDAQNYVFEADQEDFSFDEYIELAEEGGLQEDSILEIIVYSLFNAIAEELEAKAKIEIENPIPNLLCDFEDFTQTFMGLGPEKHGKETIVQIYRPGRGTYAADQGVDIGTNFGQMVQVKYVNISESAVKKIDKRAFVDEIIIVCKDAERSIIESVTSQIGYERIRAIVTISEIKKWVDKAFNEYPTTLGSKIIFFLKNEFGEEFTQGDWKIPDIENFMEDRNYSDTNLFGIWKV